MHHLVLRVLISIFSIPSHRRFLCNQIILDLHVASNEKARHGGCESASAAPSSDCFVLILSYKLRLIALIINNQFVTADNIVMVDNDVVAAGRRRV